MRKVSIIYGSTTGNTEMLANQIKDGLNNDEVKVVNVTEVTTDDVANAELVLLGSSTWGYGDIQDDFLDYYEKMDASLFQGKKVAVFGCGDKTSFEDVFCEAVTLIEEKARAIGAEIIADNLKVDGMLDENMDAISVFIDCLNK